jgi:hypothetical protein
VYLSKVKFTYSTQFTLQGSRQGLLPKFNSITKLVGGDLKSFGSNVDVLSTVFVSDEDKGNGKIGCKEAYPSKYFS